MYVDFEYLVIDLGNIKGCWLDFNKIIEVVMSVVMNVVLVFMFEFVLVVKKSKVVSFLLVVKLVNEVVDGVGK